MIEAKFENDFLQKCYEIIVPFEIILAFELDDSDISNEIYKNNVSIFG
jgi:hypothetical protein